MDYIVVSHYLSNSTTRQFFYIEMPVKQIKFEMYCPPSFNDGFNINISLKMPHSTPNGSESKILGVLVKPLDYTTQITVHNVAKIPKKIGEYDLENFSSPLLNVRGHFYDARLVDVTNTD